MTLHSSALRALEAFDPPDIPAASARSLTLDLLHARPDACLRSCPKGHLTVSAFILSPSHHLLLTHHKKLDRWLQLGGHLEEDASLEDALLREVQEESGLTSLRLSPGIFDLDVFSCPCPAPGGGHYDIRYLLFSSSEEVTLSSESLSLAWFPLSDLPLSLDASARHTIKKLPLP